MADKHDLVERGPQESPVEVQHPASGHHDNGHDPADMAGSHRVGGLVSTTVATSVETEVSIRSDSLVTSTIDLPELEMTLESLRELATRLVPAEKALEELKRLRIFANYRRSARRSFLFRLIRRPRVFLDDDFPFSRGKAPSEQLADIEAKISSTSSPLQLRNAQLELRKLRDDLRIKVGHVNSTFIGLIYSMTTSKELVEDLVQKIGHRELREEARMHLGIVSQLVERLKRLEPERLSIEAAADLSREIFGSVGVMIELEQRRWAVEELVHKDRKRRQWTVAIVIGYIAFVLAVAIGVGLKWGGRFWIGDTPLASLRLPLIGIPWPVIVWSLIGSFAAMIYRFNKKPIYDFGDAVKWMLTRPVQGVVLGAAFYLVLISGLFLFGGRATSETSSNTANDIILILSFLVGFSDRFADSVFRAIVDKYSQTRESESQEVERETIGKAAETTLR